MSGQVLVKIQVWRQTIAGDAETIVGIAGLRGWSSTTVLSLCLETLEILARNRGFVSRLLQE